MTPADAPAKTAGTPIDKKTLNDLQKQVRALADDLRKPPSELTDMAAKLRAEQSEVIRAEYDAAVRAERTRASFEAWREDVLTQVAVAWVLGCVFVRYMEDNDLVREVRIAGRGPRLQEAHDAHDAFFGEHPTWSDREYLEQVFTEAARLPGCADLLGREHNPLWLLAPSGDAAKALLEFWQARDAATGELLRVFERENGDTRFLGDLYQDLSESARKRYALLQTPEFVEEFILDRTLEPAVEEFGLEGLRLIDPTCGSGHFLLGAFRRLLGKWQRQAPGMNERDHVRMALESVFGVDVNPFAVAIARFRLLVAALRACGVGRLQDAPNFKLHLAVGDSLLHGKRFDRVGQGRFEGRDWLPDFVAKGEYDEAARILGGQYHAVVGNPPYIVDGDRMHNEAVRDRYRSCYRLFSLGVPFTERFFELATNGQRSGRVGMITTNSFMKREFGKRLIEEVIPEMDVTHIIDTSGAYIPGHGTPTVILFGRNRQPVDATVRAVLGIRGEPETPALPAAGKVWTSILELLDRPGSEDEFISVVDAARATFHTHPWSMGGGGAAELKLQLDGRGRATLESKTDSIGFHCITKQDEVFLQPQANCKRSRFESGFVRVFGLGDEVRDWQHSPEFLAIFPYDSKLQTQPLHVMPGIMHFCWPFRTTLEDRKVFGGQNYRESGKPWWEYGQIPSDKFRTPLSIAFAFVSTHNHFVLDRGGKVFNRSAPIIKLPSDSTEDDHLALLGLLNSSVACFWMKQVCHNKGATSKDGVLQDDPEKFRFEFDGTKLQQFPVARLSTDARRALIEVTRALDAGGRRLSDFSFKTFVSELLASGRASLQSECSTRITERDRLRKQMVRWQEELDWLCYELYGLLPSDSPARSLAWSAKPDGMAGLSADARPYRSADSGTCESSDPVLLERWRRLRSDPQLALLEAPAFKRRWFKSAGAYDANNLDDATILRRSVHEWLLDRLETPAYWPGDPAITTCARLADIARRDADFMQVAELYRGRADFDVTALVTELVTAEAVPALPALRYTETGLRKRADWERTWALQRREDAGENVGKIPVPPKYAPTDFQTTPSSGRGTGGGGSHCWRLRGKLDVPKERFVSYPHAERDADPTLPIAWAGWNHLQQASALASYYLSCKEVEGWTPARLTPLLTALDQLVPWLLQWHNDLDPATGERLGTFYEGFLDQERRSLTLTWDTLRSWRPPPKPRRGSGKTRP